MAHLVKVITFYKTHLELHFTYLYKSLAFTTLGDIINVCIQ